jgi:peptidoglycan/LPS O-acetylase OafA/YrhL
MTQTGSKAEPDWLARISLRRIITSNRFIPEVDGFRFLAILIVIISHIYVQCTPPIGTGLFARLFLEAFWDGKHGVYLFFTISGFILALPFARHHLQQTKPVALGSYFRRRITRLEPPYVMVMLLRAGLLLWYKQSSLSTVSIHLLASLFYVHSLIFAQYSTINPPAWSLEVEVQFYILAPLLTAVFLIRSAALRRTIIVAVILAAGLGATAFIDPSSRLSLTLLYYFQYFAAGFLLCDLYLTESHLSLPPLAWDAIGMVALLWILFGSASFYPAIFPLVTVCLYMAGFFGRFVRAFFSIPAVSIIGGMCYSIYLTHSAVLTAVHDLLERSQISSWSLSAQTVIIYSLCFAGILAIGTLYFVLIERPCMDPRVFQKLSDWLFRRRRQTA